MRFELRRQAEEILIANQAPVCPIYYYVGIQLYDPAKLGGIESNVLDEHPLRPFHRKRPLIPPGRLGQAAGLGRSQALAKFPDPLDRDLDLTKSRGMAVPDVTFAARAESTPRNDRDLLFPQQLERKSRLESPVEAIGNT